MFVILTGKTKYSYSFPERGLIRQGLTLLLKRIFISSSSITFKASMRYFELNPITRSFPSFEMITFSFTLPSSDFEVISISFYFMSSFIRLFFPTFAKSEALSILSRKSFLLRTTLVWLSFGSIS